MAKDKNKKKTKRIVMAKIDFISLCPKGANTFSTIYKSDEGSQNVDLSTICKDMDEQGEIICCVYAPEMEDSQGDIASAAVIKEFAYDFQKNGADIDIKHNGEAVSKDDIFVAESFIVQKDDPRFSDMTDYDGNAVDVAGGWGAVLKVNSEDLRKLYRSGEWGGVSMGGMAIKKSDDDMGLIEKFLKALDNYKENKTNNKKKISKKNTENIMPLTEEKVVELVAKTVAEELKKAEEVKAEELKKAAEAGPKLGLGFKEPVFPTTGATPGMVKKHLKNLEIYKLSEKVDKTDGLAIYNFNEKCEKIAKSEDLAKTMLEIGAGDDYETFYKTNQTSGQTPAEGSDSIVADLKKSNDEADKASETK